MVPVELAAIIVTGWQMSLIVLVIIAGPVLLGVLAARDMNNRAQPGWLYGLLAFTGPIGLIVWLVARRRHPREPVGPDAAPR